ncbi:hypothetical protein EVAR_103630_1 [Eumeta japonica]|uniref:CHK kinase-like domain-containing protein n=1 Tax=Eumeta variegata TaxID=151549 RepID=A0A4C1ZDP1_EUMVA|nr:hypothetical protein EVAR_103630_1 [Eumeta japonica]
MPEEKYGFNNHCLEEMVRKVVKDLHLREAVVDHKSDVKGAGYLSEVHRFVLKGSSTEIHMIAKVKPEDDEDEITMLKMFWEGELLMYELVLPEFEAIQKDSSVKLLWPLCYGIAREGSKKAILLEDLSVKGYQMCRLGKSLDLAHATLALEQLTCLHAASFVLRYLYPDRFKNLLEEREKVEKCFEYPDYLAPSIKFASDNVDCDVFQQVLKKFRHFDFKERSRYLMNGHNYEYAVITHGDMWANNMLFQYQDEKPTAVTLLDYQISSYSSPLCDLYFMLFLAVDEATRDGHFVDLVNTYERALRRQIAELGQDPERIYPKEQFQKDLRIFSFTGMAQTLFMLPIFANEHEVVEKNIEEAKGQKPIPEQTFIGVPIASPMYINRVKQMASDISRHGLDELW